MGLGDLPDLTWADFDLDLTGSPPACALYIRTRWFRPAGARALAPGTQTGRVRACGCQVVVARTLCRAQKGQKD